MERPGFRDTLTQTLWKPPLRDWRFWAVQVLVVAVAFIHLASHLQWPVPTFGMPHFSTMALFMIPVAYAALSFGLGGAVATVAWVILLMIPDLVTHTPPDRWANSVQLASILAAGLQEEERRRLSQELHDDPLQTMLYLSLKLDHSTQQPMSKEVAESLDEGRRIALEAPGGLRRLSRELRPWSLEDLELPAALRQLGSEFQEQAGIETVVTVEGTPRRLDGALELALFRVAQEALCTRTGAKRTRQRLRVRGND